MADTTDTLTLPLRHFDSLTLGRMIRSIMKEPDLSSLQSILTAPALADDLDWTRLLMWAVQSRHVACWNMVLPHLPGDYGMNSCFSYLVTALNNNDPTMVEAIFAMTPNGTSLYWRELYEAAKPYPELVLMLEGFRERRADLR